MSTIVTHSSLSDPYLHEPKGAAGAGSGEVFVADGAGSGAFQAPPAPGAGTIDHGALIGLGDDDHSQYLNEARHDGLPADNPHGVTLGQVGGEAAGTAAGIMSAHEGDADPHPDYQLEAGLPAAIAAYLDRHQVQSVVPADNDTTTLTDFINQSFTLLHTATYKVTASFYWSCNDGSQDFISQLLYNGSVVSAEVHRQEAKDVAGAGPFGTNQRHLAVITAFVAGTPGAKTFQLQYAGSAANDSAAIYDASIYVERWL